MSLVTTRRRPAGPLSAPVEEILLAKGRARFRAYRPDGWPLCPACGLEELWSGLVLRLGGDGWDPTLEQCLAHDFGCYGCGWRG